MLSSKRLCLLVVVCLGWTAALFGQEEAKPQAVSPEAPAVAAMSASSPGGETPPLQPSVGAIVPRFVKFSGTLVDMAGKPIVGISDVTFALYTEEGGGTALWYETQTVEADTLGRYTVLLGAMHANGVPVELFASGEARWLGG